MQWTWPELSSIFQRWTWSENCSWKKGTCNTLTMLHHRKNVLGYCVSLLVYPSRAQTSEILWKTLGIHDLEHSEGGVYASFKWDLCSDRVVTNSGMPKAWTSDWEYLPAFVTFLIWYVLCAINQSRFSNFKLDYLIFFKKQFLLRWASRHFMIMHQA